MATIDVFRPPLTPTVASAWVERQEKDEKTCRERDENVFLLP